MLADFFTDIALIWTAFVLFVLAVLFELWNRTQTQQAHNHKRAHPDRMDKALAYFRHHKTEKITNDLYQNITHVSHATAARDLGALIEFGILKKQGRGRGGILLFSEKKKCITKKMIQFAKNVSYI